MGDTVRELRRDRRWTQAELAGQLGLSQGRLSEIEGGKGSLTAEQFLLLLGLFNVGASRFWTAPADPEADLQNALARLGATHLQESTDVVPPDDLESVDEAIATTLTSGSSRLIAALAPVLVRHVDRINFRKLRARLVAEGFEHRLSWLLDNTRSALEEETQHALPPAQSKRYRRALVVLESALDFVPPHVRVRATATDPDLHPPDVLDAGIRSKQTLKEARAASSAISRRWGIISRLQPSHFAEALSAAREAG